MKFGPVPVAEAQGAVLAHTQRLSGADGKKGVVFKKGRVLSAEDVARLMQSGTHHVIVARFEPGDVGEDAAAHQVAQSLVRRPKTEGSDSRTAAGIRVGDPNTGRCNLFAARRGLLWFEPARVDAVNAVDPAITLATQPRSTLVEAGEMVATVKIIPFAVPALAVAAASGKAEGLLQVARLVPRRVGLVLTRIDGAESVLDRASRAQHARIEHLDGRVVQELRCAHHETEVAQAMQSMLEAGVDLILALGASAICDRRDVIPSAVDRIGGTVVHFGMPVDPGNLLLLAHKGQVPILGVPGCARSLKRSGFDTVLERLVADVPVGPDDIVRIGAGGLLAEIPTRPRPRRGAEPETKRVAAVVLAAGRSSRMGADNKLRMEVEGLPMVARVVDALLQSPVQEVLVVTGHDAEGVREALGDRPVRYVHNERFAEGMSTSLEAGIEALPEGLDGALVALGDMPFVRSEHVSRLIASLRASGPGSIVVPVHDRRRGHPVLWAARYFREMRKLTGDVGAKSLLAAHADQVEEVEVPDPSIFVDIDTRQAWEALKAR